MTKSDFLGHGVEHNIFATARPVTNPFCLFSNTSVEVRF